MPNRMLLIAFVLISSYAAAQDSAASKMMTASGEHVSLQYERPAVQDSVFGMAVPYGKIWSAGGKNATTITFKKDANFAGLPVKAGTYTMLIIPERKEWTIILNSVVSKGSFNYSANRDKDILKVTVPARTISGKVSALTYRFSDTRMIIEWEHTQVLVPVSF